MKSSYIGHRLRSTSADSRACRGAPTPLGAPLPSSSSARPLLPSAASHSCSAEPYVGSPLACVSMNDTSRGRSKASAVSHEGSANAARRGGGGASSGQRKATSTAPSASAAAGTAAFRRGAGDGGRSAAGEMNCCHAAEMLSGIAISTGALGISTETSPVRRRKTRSGADMVDGGGRRRRRRTRARAARERAPRFTDFTAVCV